MLTKEVLEYKANGNLVRETDEKEVVTQATKLPSQPVFNSDNLVDISIIMNNLPYQANLLKLSYSQNYISINILLVSN